MTQIDRRYSVAEGTAIKAPCRVATTANITLGGLQVVDGLTVVEHDRVLVWKQTDQTLNGIYEASTGNWRRTKDFDGAFDVVAGTKVDVTSGATNLTRTYRVISPDPIIIGTSAIVFLPSTSAVVSSNGEILVTDPAFGALGNGVTDDYAAIVLAKAAAIAGGYRLVFPAGVYPHNNTLDLGATGLHVVFRGNVTLKHTGTGVGVTIGDGVTHVWAGSFGRGNPPIVTGNANTTVALHEQLVDHGHVEAYIGDANAATGIGYRCSGAILTQHWISCSTNDEHVTHVVKPSVAVFIDGDTTDSEFYLIVEGMIDGITLASVRTSEFKGTSEGNSGLGVYMTVGAANNTFVNFFCEQNGSTDYKLEESGRNIFTNCIGATFLAINGAHLNNIIGGEIAHISVQVGSVHNTFKGVVFATLDIPELTTRILDLWDGGPTFEPDRVTLPPYTVAGLPSLTTASAGRIAFASNGRKSTEGPGAGSGVVVFLDSNGVWCACDTAATVSA